MDCNGKVLYAFGDSIIEGHTYPQRSCADVVADAEGMRLFKFARNGAAILPRAMTRPDLGGQIIGQCDEVPSDAPAPDVILFDGGTNDGYMDGIMDRLGAVINRAADGDDRMAVAGDRLRRPRVGDARDTVRRDDGASHESVHSDSANGVACDCRSEDAATRDERSSDDCKQDPADDIARGHAGGHDVNGAADHDALAFDRSTFAGCFEATVAEYRRRWPAARIIYVAVAKLAGVDMEIQLALRSIELDACRKGDVSVADVFDDADLDPRRDADRIAYSFDRNGSDGLPGTAQTVTYEHPERQPSGTHPNLIAVERFYAPIIRRALRAL